MKKLISIPTSRPVAAVIVSLLFSQAVFAADVTVTSPGFFYAINGNQPNPTITLVRGQTYTFAVNSAAIHPFEILSPGVVNNNISQGTITYTVPTVASNYNYICSIQLFGAQIITVAPSVPPPPTIRILSLAASNNVVLRSTGTNGWSVNPEFSTNLGFIGDGASLCGDTFRDNCLEETQPPQADHEAARRPEARARGCGARARFGRLSSRSAAFCADNGSSAATGNGDRAATEVFGF